MAERGRLQRVVLFVAILLVLLLLVRVGVLH
jgi:hypothetical protein